jgi:hypothetical protein
LSHLETVVFIAAGLLFVATWIPWLRRAATINPIALPPRIRLGLFVAPVFCALLTLTVLLTLADKDIRRDPLHLAFYLTLTTALLGAVAWLFPFFGLSVREAVLERGNVPAFIAVSAALFGVTAALAGANMGEGPGLVAVLFTGLFLVAIFLAAWFAVERFTSVSELIIVRRSRSAAVRLAGFLAALGILTGWIGAGDWVSYRATLRDAVGSLPAVLILCSAFVIIESRFEKKKFAPSLESTLSLVSALLFVALTCAWLTLRGIL